MIRQNHRGPRWRSRLPTGVLHGHEGPVRVQHLHGRRLAATGSGPRRGSPRGTAPTQNAGNLGLVVAVLLGPDWGLHRHCLGPVLGGRHENRFGLHYSRTTPFHCGARWSHLWRATLWRLGHCLGAIMLDGPGQLVLQGVSNQPLQVQPGDLATSCQHCQHDVVGKTHHTLKGGHALHELGRPGIRQEGRRYSRPAIVHAHTVGIS